MNTHVNSLFILFFLCLAVIAPFTLPLVYLSGPSLTDVRSSNLVPLICLVTGPRIKDYSIIWKVDSDIRSQGVTLEPAKDHINKTQSVQSILKIPVQEWNAFTPVSCEVKHRCSNETRVQQISKVKGKCSNQADLMLCLWRTIN